MRLCTGLTRATAAARNGSAARPWVQHSPPMTPAQNIAPTAMDWLDRRAVRRRGGDGPPGQVPFARLVAAHAGPFQPVRARVLVACDGGARRPACDHCAGGAKPPGDRGAACTAAIDGRNRWTRGWLQPLLADSVHLPLSPEADLGRSSPSRRPVARWHGCDPALTAKRPAAGRDQSKPCAFGLVWRVVGTCTGRSEWRTAIVRRRRSRSGTG